ncbi:MAG: hypothetical protein JWM28_3253, partial [Chitinophagaceae bacterium]|nr:hypothetical protein [Chitinophagaceae bacterium]
MKRIILFSLPVLAFICAFSPVTAFKVNGKISDEQGNALAGVTVKIAGSSKATLSAADGTWSLEAADGKEVLVFSFVGFDTKKEKINGRTVINVVLKAMRQRLEEVVVVAYGETNQNIALQPSPYPTQKYDALQGKVSGIIIRSQGSTVTGKRIRVRGMKTINKDGYYDQKREDFNTESYDNITENRFLKTTDNPLSTFSIDVDAASYSNVRRYLNEGQLPPAGAVRIEEMINYFHYDYPDPKNEYPFSVNTEIADCPWNKDNKLVLVGLQGKKISMENLPSSNIVFLIDVSGSMQDPQKLPLVQASMKMLAEQLREKDHVAIVVYAGAAGLVLPSTSGNEKIKIKDAIDKLEAGGSTAGGAGI